MGQISSRFRPVLRAEQGPPQERRGPRQGQRGTEPRLIAPGMVGQYFAEHPRTAPTKKQHLAAIRGLFDRLVNGHAVPLNPAASVWVARYQVIEGKTPEITAEVD